MKPLSRKKRSLYLIFLIVVFVVATPLLILYASGYRLNKESGFGSTGGLYIATSQSGIDIYLDGVHVKTTGIFQRNIFIQNLKSKLYEIRIVKEGYQEWSKVLAVYPERATEAYTFILPTISKAVEISEFLPLVVAIQNNATSTFTTATSSLATGPKNPEYTDVQALFAEKDPIVVKGRATSTPNLKIQRKVSVENVDGILHVKWLGESEGQPAYFCENDACKTEIVVQTPEKVKSFDFFQGRDDLLIVELSSGIFVVEIDDRSKQNIQSIFEGADTTFKIGDGDTIYLKQGRLFYSVSL